MLKRSLLDIIKDLNLISIEGLKELERLKKTNRPVETILLESNLISEFDLISAKSVYYETPWIDLSGVHIDVELLSLVPEKLARQHLLLPLKNGEDGFHVAIANPCNILALDDIEMISQKKVIPHLAMTSQIAEYIDHFYRPGKNITSKVVAQLEKEVAIMEEKDFSRMKVGQGPVIQLADHIISQALQNRASDIHIEPEKDGTRVRYRIDGVLSISDKFPPKIHPPLLSRLKIMANLDISQRFVPQDGAISYSYGQRNIDLRVSIIPTIYGEKAVIRILNINTQVLSLEELGFYNDDLKLYRSLLQKNCGIILITGPTGSGKSTTLTSSIKTLSSPSINISTVEDPVEYRLDEINQIQVNEKTGLTFAKALRALLRQDPDVLMIGEIRDEETASIAIRSALTGHLVLSSLHTNDAVSAIPRLNNMNIPMYLIFSTLLGVVAQRLVRRICPECRIQKNSEIEKLKKIPDITLPRKSYFGKGCSKCKHTGYSGRMGIFDILTISDELRVKLAHLNLPLEYGKLFAGKGLLKDALFKVENGMTTVEEVLRVIV